jgi:hypothetical protein
VDSLNQKTTQKTTSRPFGCGRGHTDTPGAWRTAIAVEGSWPTNGVSGRSAGCEPPEEFEMSIVSRLHCYAGWLTGSASVTSTVSAGAFWRLDSAKQGTASAAIAAENT